VEVREGIVSVYPEWFKTVIARNVVALVLPRFVYNSIDIDPDGTINLGTNHSGAWAKTYREKMLPALREVIEHVQSESKALLFVVKPPLGVYYSPREAVPEEVAPGVYVMPGFDVDGVTVYGRDFIIVAVPGGKMSVFRMIMPDTLDWAYAYWGKKESENAVKYVLSKMASNRAWERARAPRGMLH